MNKQQIHIEKRTLVLSALACLIIGTVAVIAAFLSDSQAILLDGLFNLTYFLAGLFTIKISRLVMRGDDERFPNGYSFFEALMNGIKGLLILGVSVMALYGAIEALLEGGRNIKPGIAIIYAVFASSAGWLLAILSKKGYQDSQSPLVRADADGWIVNAAISSAVLIAFIGVYAIQDTEYSHIAPYIDPSLVIIVVLISLSVPIRMSWQALMGLLNRAPSPEIVESVTHTVRESLTDWPVEELFVRVIQPGRVRGIMVHVVLPENYPATELALFDQQRERTLQALKAAHGMIIMDIVFTTQRKWGAPASHM
jgi:cation diffusion facilitator family transporter